MDRLKGKAALITGAGSGIGRAGVKLFLDAGARVVASGRDAGKLDRMSNDIASSGLCVETIVADLARPDQARMIVKEAIARLGSLDILWCNAGTMGPGIVEDLAEGDVEETIATNLTSVMVGCGAAIPYMRARGGGSIVITSSTSGLVGAMGSPSYSASKFGVIGWAKSLAQRVAADGIRVNVICPGPTATPQMLEVMRDGSGALSGPQYSERLLAGIPLGRLGTAEEQARAALWLASDEASFITGVALPVDGGYTCR